MTQCHRLCCFLEMAREHLAGGGHEPLSAANQPWPPGRSPGRRWWCARTGYPTASLPAENPATSAGSSILIFEQRTQNTLNKCYGLIDRKGELRKSLRREGAWLRAPSCVKVLKRQRAAYRKDFLGSRSNEMVQGKQHPELTLKYQGGPSLSPFSILLKKHGLGEGRLCRGH